MDDSECSMKVTTRSYQLARLHKRLYPENIIAVVANHYASLQMSRGHQGARSYDKLASEIVTTAVAGDSNDDRADNVRAKLHCWSVHLVKDYDITR